jgi:hypothetical protein
VNQVLSGARKHRRSCWVWQFAQARTLLKPNSDRGEYPFHSQFARHNQRHPRECLRYNFREHLRREFRQGQSRELWRSHPCDLHHRRPHVLRLRVPTHRWPEGCRQAPHLLRPLSHLMTFSFGMDGVIRHGGLVTRWRARRNRCRRCVGLKNGKS